MNEKSVRLVAYCSPMLKAQVENQATREGESMAYIVRKALREYLARRRPEHNVIAE